MLNAALGAISTLADAGGVARAVQGRLYQKENVSWIRRNYVLDTQAMRLDLLSSAKDEIRAHYETYLTRLDTLLLVTALLWPFGLASLQFSDEFIPQTEDVCGYCIEAKHPWLISVWVWLVGIILFLPMWSCTLLVRCKLKLDSWLKLSLASLNQERRATLTALNQPVKVMQEGDPTAAPKAETAMSEELHKEMEEVVQRLGSFIVQYQDQFSHVWNVECGGQVRLATALLGFDAVFALLLTAFMFWLYLMNHSEPGNNFYGTATFLAAIIGVGLLSPFFYIFGSWICSRKDVDGGGGFNNLVTPRAPAVRENMARSSSERSTSRENTLRSTVVSRESTIGQHVASSNSGIIRSESGSGLFRQRSGNQAAAPVSTVSPAAVSLPDSSGASQHNNVTGSQASQPSQLSVVESVGSFQDASSFHDDQAAGESFESAVGTFKRR